MFSDDNKRVYDSLPDTGYKTTNNLYIVGKNDIDNGKYQIGTTIQDYSKYRTLDGSTPTYTSVYGYGDKNADVRQKQLNASKKADKKTSSVIGNAKQLLTKIGVSGINALNGSGTSSSLGSYKPYSDPYGSSYNNILNQIGSYGQFNDPYSGMHNNIRNQIANYGDFNYKNQGLLDNAMNGVDSYGNFNYGLDSLLNNTIGNISSYGDYNYGLEDVLNNTIGNIADYGSYESPYRDTINGLQDKLLNYGSYEGKYNDEISSLVDRVLNGQYNPNNDSSYLAYKNEYTRDGKKAMEDTLARGTALSGGYDNSYAQSVAQQTYNDYMSKLADKAVGLEAERRNNDLSRLSVLNGLDSTEYSRWANDQNNLYNLNNMLQNAENIDFNQWADNRNNLYNIANMLQNDKSMDYDMWHNNLGDLYNQVGMLQNDKSMNYDLWHNGLSDLYNQIGMYQNDRNIDYGEWADGLNNLYNQENMYQNATNQAFDVYNSGLNNLYNQASLMQSIRNDDYNKYLNERDYQTQLKSLALQQQQAQQQAQANAKQQAFDNQYKYDKMNNDLLKAMINKSGSSSSNTTGTTSTTNDRYTDAELENHIDSTYKTLGYDGTISYIQQLAESGAIDYAQGNVAIDELERLEENAKYGF